MWCILNGSVRPHEAHDITTPEVSSGEVQLGQPKPFDVKEVLFVPVAGSTAAIALRIASSTIGASPVSPKSQYI